MKLVPVMSCNTHWLTYESHANNSRGTLSPCPPMGVPASYTSPAGCLVVGTNVAGLSFGLVKPLVVWSGLFPCCPTPPIRLRSWPAGQTSLWRPDWEAWGCYRWVAKTPEWQGTTYYPKIIQILSTSLWGFHSVVLADKTYEFHIIISPTAVWTCINVSASLTHSLILTLEPGWYIGRLILSAHHRYISIGTCWLDLMAQMQKGISVRKCFMDGICYQYLSWYIVCFYLQIRFIIIHLLYLL